METVLGKAEVAARNKLPDILYAKRAIVLNKGPVKIGSVGHVSGYMQGTGIRVIHSNGRISYKTTIDLYKDWEV